MAYRAVVGKINDLVITGAQQRFVEDNWSNLVMNFISTKLQEGDREGELGEIVQEWDYEVMVERNNNRLTVTFEIPDEVEALFFSQEFVEWANSDAGRADGLGDNWRVISCDEEVIDFGPVNNGGRRRKKTTGKRKTTAGKRRSSKKRSSQRRRRRSSKKLKRRV